MKPPQAANYVNHSTITYRYDSHQRIILSSVAAARTLVLQNEFAPPAIRTIWTAMEQGRKESNDAKRRRKR